MMGDQPVLSPLFHVSPIRAALVTAVLSASPTGEDGTRTITAPLPGAEAADSPYELDAVTIASTLSP
jgi:hypothetical protein